MSLWSYNAGAIIGISPLFAKKISSIFNNFVGSLSVAKLATICWFCQVYWAFIE
jgi:hypothetical protein